MASQGGHTAPPTTFANSDLGSRDSQTEAGGASVNFEARHDWAILWDFG